MPTTFANTINSNPIYADRAVHDAAGNDIQTTYATKSELPSVPVTDVEVDGVSVVSSGVASITMPTIPVTDVEVDGVSVVSSGVASITSPTVDQTYNSASTNAQSGTAVAGAIAGVNQVPSSTSSDADKVLTVNSQGVPGWATAQVPQSKPVVAGSNITITENTNNVTISASGMTQLQSNWNETSSSSPQYIQNKPSIPVLPTTKPVVAGSNITITENTNDVTISATGGTTYSAGTGIDITGTTISVDTPVDIVAGPGIVIDNPDGNTMRVTNVGFPISETDAVRCGTFKNDPMFMKTYTFTGTVGTSETTINMTIDEKKGTDGVNRIWIDPSNSFVLYGSSGTNILPITWRLASGRQGSVGVIGAASGNLSCRCIDTSSTPLTFNITIRYTVSA